MIQENSTFELKIMVNHRRITAYPRLGNCEPYESIEWLNMTNEFVIRWGWYFKYRAALMQVKYPKGYIDFQAWTSEPDTRSLKRIEADRKKRRITTCKRMVTKLSNWINEYTEEEMQKLIPDFENENYLLVMKKLARYQEELKKLQSNH